MSNSFQSCVVITILGIHAVVSAYSYEEQHIGKSGGEKTPATPVRPAMFDVPCLVGDAQVPVLSMHFERSGFIVLPPGATYTELPVQVIVAVFSSGRMVWSEDLHYGGPPYHVGQVEAKQLTLLLKQIKDEEITSKSLLWRPLFGPDASYTCFSICLGPNLNLQMRSWHEYRPIDVHDWNARRFVDVWDKTKRGILALRPVDNKIDHSIRFELRERQVLARTETDGRGQ